MSDPGATAARSAGQRYLEGSAALVTRLLDEAWPAIDAGATLIADALAEGGTLHAFGSGHSHLLAEELYHRAGGLMRMRPVLFDGITLHGGAELATQLERLPGVAAAILAEHPLAPGDACIIASNSGGNAVITEFARLAREAGARTIGITSIRHATSPSARSTGSQKLHELVDVAIDNLGIPGDAAIAIPGMAGRVGPTSTVAGAAIVNALVAEAIERLVARGITPPVFISSNLAGGDEANAQGAAR
ncbi:MAG: SIS domain-containing protein [Chloroflexota bacterium]